MTDQLSPNNRRPQVEIGLALLALAFCLAVVFQTVQLVRERINFANIMLKQETILGNVLDLEKRLNALASDTAQLAQSGNTAAKHVVADLARQHIELHPVDNLKAATTSR